MDELDWRARAVCRGVDPELFFPAAEAGTAAYDRQVADAKRVCGICPVRAQCLDWALTALPYGVAGRLSADERAALRRFHRDAARRRARALAERIRARGA
jgi:hypothetical protein